MAKILIVSPVECFPEHAGNSARVATFLKFIKDKNIDFRYLHLPDRPFNPQPMIDALGNRYIYQPYKPRKQFVRRLRYRAAMSILTLKKYRLIKVDDFILSSEIKLYESVLLDYQPDVVLVNYTYLSKLLDYTPQSIIKIIDTHDSLYLRFKSIYNSDKPLYRFRITIEDEIRALNRADKVVSIQAEEEAFFKKHGCKAALLTIGHHIPFKIPKSRAVKNKLLYIGSNYSANMDAIIYFLDEIWPSVLRINPSVQLLIAGAISEGLKDAGKQYPSVKFLGHVRNLQHVYDEIDVAINPVRIGSGMKIKNIEALSYGRPVITTRLGAEGLGAFDGNGMLIAEGVTNWLTIIEQCLTDATFYEKTIASIQNTIVAYNKTNRAMLEKLLVP